MHHADNSRALRDYPGDPPDPDDGTDYDAAYGEPPAPLVTRIREAMPPAEAFGRGEMASALREAAADILDGLAYLAAGLGIEPNVCRAWYAGQVTAALVKIRLAVGLEADPETETERALAWFALAPKWRLTFGAPPADQHLADGPPAGLIYVAYKTEPGRGRVVECFKPTATAAVRAAFDLDRGGDAGKAVAAGTLRYGMPEAEPAGETGPDQKLCGCGALAIPEAVNDGHGIFLFYACEACRDEKLSHYRPDILERYPTEERIEPEE